MCVQDCVQIDRTDPLDALLDAEALANLMRRRWQEIENRREP